MRPDDRISDQKALATAENESRQAESFVKGILPRRACFSKQRNLGKTIIKQWQLLLAIWKHIESQGARTCYFSSWQDTSLDAAWRRTQVKLRGSASETAKDNEEQISGKDRLYTCLDQKRGLTSQGIIICNQAQTIEQKTLWQKSKPSKAKTPHQSPWSHH